MNKLLTLLFCALPLSGIMAQKSDTIADHTKKADFTALPTLSFDRSKGTGFGLISMAFFKMNQNPNTKPSSVMVMGKYTTKKNWNAMGMAQLYFAEDKYRVSFGGGYMNNNFQTYEDIGGGQVEVPYNNHGGFVFLMPMIRVWDKLYIGLGGQMFKSYLTIDNPDDETADTENNEWMNSIALTPTFDSKDNPYNATSGINTSVRFNYFPVWLKNSETFYKMHAEFNHYKRLDHSKVLASRAAMNIGLGDVPFVGQNYVGGKDIRGYTKGEYRGDQTYSIQSELRWNLYKKWGAVGFFGLAMAVSPDDTSPLLPGGGVGARYLVVPKYNINAGIDAAVGKDDWGIYFRITEAF